MHRKRVLTNAEFDEETGEKNQKNVVLEGFLADGKHFSAGAKGLVDSSIQNFYHAINQLHKDQNRNQQYKETREEIPGDNGVVRNVCVAVNGNPMQDPQVQAQYMMLRKQWRDDGGSIISADVFNQFELRAMQIASFRRGIHGFIKFMRVHTMYALGSRSIVVHHMRVNCLSPPKTDTNMPIWAFTPETPIPQYLDVHTFMDKTDKVGKVNRIYRNVEGTEKELCWVTMILLYVAHGMVLTHRLPLCSPAGLDQRS